MQSSQPTDELFPTQDSLSISDDGPIFRAEFAQLPFDGSSSYPQLTTVSARWTSYAFDRGNLIRDGDVSTKPH